MNVDRDCPCHENSDYGYHSKERVNYILVPPSKTGFITPFRPCTQHAKFYEGSHWTKVMDKVESSVKYYYLRDKQNIPIACLATKIVGKRIYAGLSVWNPKDKFSKEEARKYAFERLNGPFAAKFTYNAPLSACKVAIMVQVALDIEVPNKVRTAAKIWVGEK